MKYEVLVVDAHHVQLVADRAHVVAVYDVLVRAACVDVDTGTPCGGEV